MSYNYHRNYDPTIGRYVESDPIGLKGGIDLYAYAQSRPLTDIDFTGLAPAAPCGGGPCDAFKDVGDVFVKACEACRARNWFGFVRRVCCQFTFDKCNEGNEDKSVPDSEIKQARCRLAQMKCNNGG